MLDRQKWILIITLLIIGVWHIALGQLFIDDAYIFFRYARHFAEGDGLVYNSGEQIMGFTSPLYVLWLGFWHALGIDLNIIALATGVLCNMAIVAAIYSIVFLATDNFWGGVFAMTLFAFSPKGALPALMGMETALFLALILAAIFFFNENKVLFGAIFSGLVALTRPEGVAFLGLVLFWLVIHGFSNNKITYYWRAISLALIPIVCWSVFAIKYYDGLLPMSMLAKAITYPRYESPFHNSLLLVRYATMPFEWVPEMPVLSWDNVMLGGLVVIGIVYWMAEFLSKPFSIYIVWIIGIGGGYAFVNRYLFPWYFAPFYLGAVIFLVLGILAAIKWILKICQSLEFFRVKNAIKYIYLTVGIVCVGGLAFITVMTAFTMRTSIRLREEAYRAVGLWLNETCPDAIVASPEIGALGLAFKGEILDLSGLVSPSVMDYYRDPNYQFVFPHRIPPRLWVDFQPDVVVSFDRFLTKIVDDAWFKQQYSLILRCSENHPYYGALEVFVSRLSEHCRIEK